MELEEIRANTCPNHPIPPPNTQTTKLEEVYSLSDIVTEPELSAIHIKPILQEQNERNRALLLPFKFDKYFYKKSYSSCLEIRDMLMNICQTH